MTIVAHLQTQPMVIIEVPEGVRLSPAQTKEAEYWKMPITFEVYSPKELQPDKFAAAVGRANVTCRTTGGVLKCLGNYDADLEISPSGGGMFTGKFKSLPVIYKYQ